MKRRLLAFLALVALAVVLAGCSGITALQDTKTALQDRGFGSVNVSPAGNSNDISVSVRVAAESTDATASVVANVVWQSCHVRFDMLQVTVHGTGGTETQDLYTFAQLQETFGPRNPAWNKDTLHGTLVQTGVVVLVVVLVIIVGSVITIVVVRRRHRRRRAGQWPQYGGGPGYPGGAVPGYQGGGYPGGPPTGGYPPAWPGSPPPSGGYPPAQTGYPPAQPGYPPAQPGYPPAQQPPVYPPEQSGYPPAPSFPPAPTFPPQYPPPPPSDPPYPSAPPAPPAGPADQPDEETPPGG